MLALATLLPGFNAQAGGIVNIYIAPYDCSEWAGFIVPPLRNLVSEIDEIEVSKEIQLSFAKDFSENSISVFPNPANHTVTIQLHSNDTNNELNHIKLYDIFGRTILSISADINPIVLNVSQCPKGIYFIEVKDTTKTYYQKIIIH